jgi:Ca2+-binding RTX toxin-like protein
MMIKLAAVAASVAAIGLFTIPAAQADKPPCTGDRHHSCECPPDKNKHDDGDDCPVVPPAPVPSGFNLIFGGRNADRLPGTAGRDAIFGFGGNDRIFGRGGADRLYGMRGNDVIRSVDRSRDVVNGGPGRDRCIVNRNDIVKNCETIIVVL